MGHHDHASWFAELAAELTVPRDEVVTTNRILKWALEMVADADHVSITIRSGKRYRTLASSSDLARDCDRLQYELGEGPCIDSATHGDWFRSGDLAVDARWPRWGPVAARLGAGSLLSIRLLSEDKPFGALNLYSDDRGEFADPEQVEIALLFTVHATSALVAARLVSDLETALSSRYDIGVAQGILMAAYDLTNEQSFAALRRVSSQTNVKLRDVAAEVIRTRRLPGQEVT
jgi:GAF domain-containing protein